MVRDVGKEKFELKLTISAAGLLLQQVFESLVGSMGLFCGSPDTVNLIQISCRLSDG